MNYEIQTQYERIEEMCYRTNVPVDDFYKVLVKMHRSPEEHLNILSELEKSIEDMEIDYGD